MGHLGVCVWGRCWRHHPKLLLFELRNICEISYRWCFLQYGLCFPSVKDSWGIKAASAHYRQKLLNYVTFYVKENTERVHLLQNQNIQPCGLPAAEPQRRGCLLFKMGDKSGYIAHVSFLTESQPRRWSANICISSRLGWFGIKPVLMQLDTETNQMRNSWSVVSLFPPAGGKWKDFFP